jgi:hypothetical protein
MRVIASLLVACALAACGPPNECGPTAQCLSPHVYVDVCTAEPQHKVAGEIIGGVDACAIDFGVVGLFGGEGAARFTNPGKLPVEVDVALVGEPFAIVSAPRTIDGGFSEDLVLSVPALNTQQVARVVVTTDAANIPAENDGTIEIAVTARSGVR